MHLLSHPRPPAESRHASDPAYRLRPAPADVSGAAARPALHHRGDRRRLWHLAQPPDEGGAEARPRGLCRQPTQIGRAHVCTPVTTAPLLFCHLLEEKKTQSPLTK